MKILRHFLVVIAALFLALGVPALFYVDIPALISGTADAVTHASTMLPEQPSGEFYVLVNRETQGKYMEQWNAFFTDSGAVVIMSDIRCMTAEGDAAAIQLAERFQARLPENQMTITKENGLLMASKAESGVFDAIVVSVETAQAYHMESIISRNSIACITVKGE